MARFLARVFDADPKGWILEGGVGMMVRPLDARYGKDIDLLTGTEMPEAVKSGDAGGVPRDPGRYTAGLIEDSQRTTGADSDSPRKR